MSQMGLTGLKSRYEQASFFSGGSKLDSFSCLSEILQATCILWLVAFHFNNQKWLVESFSHYMALTLISSSTLKGFTF